ncbi:D-beta-hydroxybutyrate dehydrogenase, mitochondrial-like [Protopterus annectens]|uniref:D-beta-hydroxybutyrate dehydrogenase, mitochondrial-like n=1 Tax=Protopterus annectens TaxID=7888 RepID=UPI001CFA15B6|nr:D-beta-hydroxybutyrate dehydrogenase, mitochondrial-like [Protopterus annectens]
MINLCFNDYRVEVYRGLKAADCKNLKRKMLPLIFFLVTLVLALGYGLFWLEAFSSLSVFLGLPDSPVTHALILVIFLTALCSILPFIPRGSIQIDGKAVLITGCDTGFGFALAKHLHALGFTVFAGCLLKNQNGNGAKQLEAMKSNRMKVLQLDVTSDEQVSQALQFVRKNLEDPDKDLWCIVNNAGIITYGEVEFTSLRKYKEVAEVNLWGTVRVTKAFLPLIRRSKGRIVNIASMAGRFSLYLWSAYAMSKFGVVAFSDALRNEMHHWGVKVILIEPGMFAAATNLLTHDRIQTLAEEIWSEVSDAVCEDYGKPYLDKQMHAVNDMCSSGTKDMSPVITDITDAVTSRFPYTRYNPMDAYWWIKLQLFTHLPAAFTDIFNHF